MLNIHLMVCILFLKLVPCKTKLFKAVTLLAWEKPKVQAVHLVLLSDTEL
jgi:hypothetical protein